MLLSCKNVLLNQWKHQIVPLMLSSVSRWPFRVQSQVDEVIDVMQENISKVIERGERLDELQDKSGKMDMDRSL